MEVATWALGDAGIFRTTKHATGSFTPRRAEALAEAFSAVHKPGILETVWNNQSCPAVAAAAVLAAAIDGNGKGLPKEAKALAREVNATPELCVAAIEALDIVLGPTSNLRDVWLDTSDGKKWCKSIVELRRRLAAASTEALATVVSGRARAKTLTLSTIAWDFRRSRYLDVASLVALVNHLPVENSGRRVWFARWQSSMAA